MGETSEGEKEKVFAISNICGTVCACERGGRCYIIPQTKQKKKEKVFRFGEFGFPVKFIFIYLEHRTQGWLREGKAKQREL